MGKGDKKSKRGKIIIGSSGVSRSRKKKRTILPVAAKAEPKPKKEVEELVESVVKTAARKTAKKAEDHATGAEEKPKAAKAKKKADEGETEVTPEA
ncbi:MAG: 30S ribosomal protein THX [bacterium]